MTPELLESLDKSELKALVLQLFARVEALETQNRALVSRIAELEARLAQPPKTPDNSSLPPSSGQKGNVASTSGKRKKGRKGRPGVARDLCAIPDAVRDIHADRCGCGAKIPASGQTLAHAYDHIDLPPIRPSPTLVGMMPVNSSVGSRARRARPIA